MCRELEDYVKLTSIILYKLLGTVVIVVRKLMTELSGALGEMLVELDSDFS